LLWDLGVGDVELAYQGACGVTLGVIYIWVIAG
jgi:hypothetical protein